MPDVNSVILIGRLARDVSLKRTTSGTAVAKFFIAVNKKRKSGDTWKDEAQFFEIVVWGKLAESLNNYLVKGKQIAVTGELSQERWSGDDGQNHSKITVTASTIQLLAGGSSNSDNAGHKQEPYPADAADEGYVDDIPF
jgi:single-strand DNA-binding protein